MRFLLTALFLTLLMPAACVAATLVPQQVDIPLSGGTLRAQLYKPAGDGPFPTVIALHGCSGLGSRDEPVLSRYRDWAVQLLESGYAVLWPDSYGSRQLGPQCHVKEVRVKASRERVADIVATRGWLMKQSWVEHNRISLIGWANGASALLWAVRPQILSHNTEPDFRAAVAFYPDCRISAGLGWSSRVPTLVLIGAKDDVSSPPACRQMVDGAHGRSALARIVVYPGANHDFDRASSASRGLELAAPDHVRAGTNTEARADSQKQVAKWLAR